MLPAVALQEIFDQNAANFLIPVEDIIGPFNFQPGAQKRAQHIVNGQADGFVEFKLLFNAQKRRLKQHTEAQIFARLAVPAVAHLPPSGKLFVCHNYSALGQWLRF